MGTDYYNEKLSAHKLKRCYEIAPPRVQQYLDAEISHVLNRIAPADIVLELGCGYGRILPKLAQKAHQVIGIDNAFESIKMGQKMLECLSNCHLLCMDASQLGFPDETFDCVICIQNGISAFHIDQRRLVREAVRVTRQGGIAMFSTYSEKFWDDRLEWFRLQSEAGLLGEIDWERTGNGKIICKDGFTATTVSPAQFLELVDDLKCDVRIIEVDNSSLFLEVIRR